jgi:hypothetical protein
MRMGALIGLSARQYSILLPCKQPSTICSASTDKGAKPRPMVSVTGDKITERLERHNPIPLKVEGLFDRIYQGGHALDSDLKAISGLDGADSTRCSGENDITGKQCHIRRNKAHQIVAIKDQLAC